jgi:hypothetical protein
MILQGIYAKNVQILPFLLMREQPVLNRHNPFFDRFSLRNSQVWRFLLLIVHLSIPIPMIYAGFCSKTCNFSPKMLSDEQPF